MANLKDPKSELEQVIEQVRLSRDRACDAIRVQCDSAIKAARDAAHAMPTTDLTELISRSALALTLGITQDGSSNRGTIGERRNLREYINLDWGGYQMTLQFRDSDYLYGSHDAAKTVLPDGKYRILLFVLPIKD